MDHTTRPFVEGGPLGIRVSEISREPIPLYQISRNLKVWVGRGGEAKPMVSAGQVLLNGKVDIHTRKYILAGETIPFADEKIRIQLSPTHGTEHHEVTGTPT